MPIKMDACYVQLVNTRRQENDVNHVLQEATHPQTEQQNVFDVVVVEKPIQLQQDVIIVKLDTFHQMMDNVNYVQSTSSQLISARVNVINAALVLKSETAQEQQIVNCAFQGSTRLTLVNVKLVQKVNTPPSQEPRNVRSVVVVTKPTRSELDV